MEFPKLTELDPEIKGVRKSEAVAMIASRRGKSRLAKLYREHGYTGLADETEAEERRMEAAAKIEYDTQQAALRAERLVVLGGDAKHTSAQLRALTAKLSDKGFEVIQPPSEIAPEDLVERLSQGIETYGEHPVPHKPRKPKKRRLKRKPGRL